MLPPRTWALHERAHHGAYPCRGCTSDRREPLALKAQLADAQLERDRCTSKHRAWPWPRPKAVPQPAQPVSLWRWLRTTG
jgi:hypothetical protein